MTKNLPFPEFVIRSATVDDIPLIQNIVKATWPEAYISIIGKEQVNYMLEKFYSTPSLTDQLKNNHYFFLALKNSLPVGFASFSTVYQNVYKLQKLYVLPSEQKTGAGKALLQKVEKEAKKLGAVKLQLNVNRKNIAKTFYEKNSFAVIRHEDIDIENGFFMNDFVMEKDL